MIHDGIAEHYRKITVGGGRSRIVRTLSIKETKRILRNIRPIVKKSNPKIYVELFYGSGRYPLWTGYALGYHLVQQCIKINPNSSKDILKLDPETVIENRLARVKKKKHKT